MKKTKQKYITKTLSAPGDFWDRLNMAQIQLGIDSRSNLIRMAVEKYLESLQVKNGNPQP